MQKIKNSRALSFVAIALVYAVAGGIGILSYTLLPFGFMLNLFIADVIATVVTFIFSLIFSNASVYDPYWSVQPPVILTAFAIHYGVNALGVALLIAVWFWAIRLTANWAYTFKGLTHQDWRYTMLREKTRAFYPIINLLGIHAFPTLVVYACTLPAVYAIAHSVNFTAPAAVFCALAIASAAMQGVSDVQMHRFRKSGVGGFVRTGLWKYSRHPNYLGEILNWWFIGLAVVVCLPEVWWLLTGALINTVMFLVVSIPMADKRQSRKEGWQEYKRQTRMLLPVYKKQ